MTLSVGNRKVYSSTSYEVLEEVFQMWKAILEAVIESFAYADPMGHMYYVAAKREAAEQAEPTQAMTCGTRPVLRLVAPSRAQEEAPA